MAYLLFNTNNGWARWLSFSYHLPKRTEVSGSAEDAGEDKRSSLKMEKAYKCIQQQI